MLSRKIRPKPQGRYPIVTLSIKILTLEEKRKKNTPIGEIVQTGEKANSMTQIKMLVGIS